MRPICLLALFVAACAAPPRIPAPTTERPDLDRAALEKAVHEHVNAVRRQHHRPPFGWEAALRDLAYRHSSDMASEGFFDHYNRRGEDVNRRARRKGMSCVKVDGNLIYEGFGENLLETYRYGSYTRRVENGYTTVTFNWKTVDDIAREAVQGWLDSPPHRENLLSPHYDAQGIGVAFSDDDRVYITQNLC